MDWIFLGGGGWAVLNEPGNDHITIKEIKHNRSSEKILKRLK